MNKSWRILSGESAEVVSGLVQEVVRHGRQRGEKTPYAIEDAALSLGLTTRRARAFYYREVFSVARDEYLAILRRFVARLDREAAELDRRAAELRERQLAVRQANLNIGDAACSTPSPCGLRSGDGAVRSMPMTGRGQRDGRSAPASSGPGSRPRVA